MENYFEALKLDLKEDLKDLKNQNETEFNEFKKNVNTKHHAEYNRVLQLASAGQNIPGLTEEKIADLKDLLNKAKKTLTDRAKRDQHIDDLLKPDPDPIPTPIPTPDPHYDPPPRQQSTRPIVKFRNRDEATSIPQLVTLMERNSREATDILYSGDLALGLAGAAETPLAGAARAVVSQFSSDRSIGLMAMVAILRSKIKFPRGGEAGTPQQLAHLIDRNWEQAKTLLYNGFIGLWLEHTQQSRLAGIAKKITSTYSNDKDIGLEELVQRLDPQIGAPELELNHSKIDFGRMDTESQKTIRFDIKNTGRGFLYGDVQLASNLPGLQISNTKIQGKGVVTVKLDASALTVKQAHQGALVINTNGGNLKVPISCYIDYPVQQSVQRVAISGFAVAAIALVTRLIIQQFGHSNWLITGFMDWSQYWSWVEWFEWPWFEWRVYTLSAPGTGLGFVIALASLGAGIFAYWFYFFKKKRVR